MRYAATHQWYSALDSIASGLGAGSFTNDNPKKATDVIDTEQGWVVISADKPPGCAEMGA